MTLEAIRASADLGEALRAFVSAGHNAALGLEPVGHGDGWIEFRLPWKPELAAVAGGDRVAPGVLYSLLDSACSMTPWAKLGRFSPSPTLDLRVDYIRRPAPRADLFAHGTCTAITPQLALVRGVVHEGDPDDPVAQCTGSFMFADLK